MEIDPVTHRLRGARQLESPNCDERPAGCRPELIVIHGISLPPGCYGGADIDRLFTNCLDPGGHPYFREIACLRVSSHLLIRRDGELVQYVPFDKRAWHAGESCFGGRPACNDFSIGIELEGQDDEPYAPVQYERLAAVTEALVRTYPGLSRQAIAGHSDIAPGRKTDPGPAFDWDGFRARLGSRYA
ncbi:MAG: 1,6-anhydro-N-acetylmuramyl-L-alanine amidase AmpD [Gammaproteobacteria bacterium]